MIVSSDHQLVFIAIPRTSSNSMARVMTRKLKGRRVEGSHHATAVPEFARGFTTFTIVRNPYDRLYSLWRHRCMGVNAPYQGASFSWYLEKMLYWLKKGQDEFRPQIWFADQVDVVLRFEHLLEDLALLGPRGMLMVEGMKGTHLAASDNPAVLRGLSAVKLMSSAERRWIEDWESDAFNTWSYQRWEQ